jgi:membrane protease YdiL (CAAX protease family)
MIASIIRKLSPAAEFCLIMLVCCWWAIYVNIVAIARHSWSTTSQAPQPITGIGIELGSQGDKVIISQVVPNTPAAKAGLSPGLVIQTIDGTPTAGKLPEECGDMLRGPAASKVTLELIDSNRHRTNSVELTRETFADPPLKRHITNPAVLTVAAIELLGLAVTFWIARTRGWRLGTWGFQPSWKLTGGGVLLFFLAALMIAGVATTANLISPGTVQSAAVSHLSIPVLLLFSLINGVFEEIVEVGYFVQSLQRYGVWTTVLASAFFRAFLHSYQGIPALLIILPFGLVFGLVYWKWRRLWPLFVAHVLFDLWAFFPR